VIAPVSGQIPCKQGILEGFLLFRGTGDRLQTKKPLHRSHFSNNSLNGLTGKAFLVTGNFDTTTGILFRDIALGFEHSPHAVLGTAVGSNRGHATTDTDTR
jgi:hypothetical protein